MKHYFKYDSGYVNINDENLFLTSSGNWQETHDLEEKSRATIAQNERRINRMKSFVYVVFGGAGIGIYKILNNKEASIGITVVLIAMAYYVLQYYKSDFGKRYKIPLGKIEGIERHERQGLKINFRNVNNEPDFEVIENVDPKGFNIMEEIKLITSMKQS